MKYLTQQQVADALGMSFRSARRVMDEVGVTIVSHKPLVLETAFQRYLDDRTERTFYNRDLTWFEARHKGSMRRT